MVFDEVAVIEVPAVAAIPVVAPVRDTPYNIVMGIWAQWMRLADVQHTNGYGNEQDSKEFMAVGSAVDVMVGDLPRVQWWAIHKARGLSASVWRFPETSITDALQCAEAAITPKMKKNLATRRYFELG